jgi:hypothetical protein
MARRASCLIVCYIQPEGCTAFYLSACGEGVLLVRGADAEPVKQSGRRRKHLFVFVAASGACEAKQATRGQCVKLHDLDPVHTHDNADPVTPVPEPCYP